MRLATAAIVLLLISGNAAHVAGESLDDVPEAVSLYAQGKRMLRQGDWLQAARIFEELTGRFPRSRNIDLFLFNRAKAEYYFGEYDEALAGFNSFALRFMGSPYCAHARFFAGNIYHHRGNLSRALASYIDAFGLSGDAALDELVIGSIRALLDRAGTVSVGPADFTELQAEKRCRLIRSVAEVLVKRNEVYSAKTLLAMCGEKLDPAVVQQARDDDLSRELEVAVVLPLSGEMQAFGDEIYNGAVIAAELYRRETGKAVKLVPYDTKRDPINAARIIRELANSSTDAVIGPLTSDEAAVVSAVLSCENLPLIAPAATQAGLTGLNRSAFQLSPNIELQAVQMAEYAVMNLHADTAAIITSTSTDHLQMSRAFAKRFAESGGTIIAVEYYRPRDKDFGPYVQDIKTALLGVPSDSVYFVDVSGDTLEVDGIPAHVDCLYLPGTASQLRLLLPQIHFYNLSAVYLGSDGWGDEAIYRLGDDITKEAVFPSPFLQTSAGREYTSFSTAYDTRYGKPPQRLAALGYDAVRCITRAVLDGGVTREKLIEKLRQVRGYDGAAARVTFGENRENIEMPIYRIQDAAPVQVGIALPASDAQAP
ncbi:MAG TPA: penicillin-binding protein activator [Acidobacteriota bacterium]|nr:penicillin-binding protein activator [Acidobacteriota bacterium]